MDNFEVLPVDINDYQVALEVSARAAISINYAVAYIKMMKESIKKIYTFDKYFRNLKNIEILPTPDQYE